MTERTGQRSPWRRALSKTRARTEGAALTFVIIACAVMAVDVVPAIAEETKLAGRPAPEKAVPHLVAAALSCPALSPPKLAAQVMAATGFGTDGANRGWAGLDDASWSQWRPSSGANRGDHGDSVLAMAHRTCEVVGRLRVAGVDGDLWAAAVATDKAGLPAVIKAKGVPESARSYVDKVEAYRNWYADQPQFGGGEPPKTPAPTASEQATAVPAHLVDSIKAAGRICPTITPARVAAQLGAVSGFDASLRSDNGAVGIAQFSDDLWNDYQQRSSASRWNPDDAIMALGAAMCDLSNQFAALNGADPYTLALGAYQWGPQVIRQANGLPEGNVPQLADRVGRFVTTYEKDARLTAKPPKPSPSATPKPTATLSASPSSPRPSASASVPPMAPGPVKPGSSPNPVPTIPEVAFDPAARYHLRNVWAGAVLELPGDELKHPSGKRVQLYRDKNGKDQFWRISKAKAEGHVTIVNDFSDQALAIEKASTANGAKLVVATKDDNARTQQWKLIDAGGGMVIIRNRHSGRVMELFGTDFGAPNKDGTWNGYLVQQYDREPATNRDQHWFLVK